MDSLLKRECVTCKRTEDDTHLFKCAVCYRYYCGEHRYVMSGREFCCKPCAQYFYFPDDED